MQEFDDWLAFSKVMDKNTVAPFSKHGVVTAISCVSYCVYESNWQVCI